MGRTIPSFRIAATIEKKEWKSFRELLDKEDRKIFDEIFIIPQLYNSACSFYTNPIVIRPIFMSILLEHYRQLKSLQEILERRRVNDQSNSTLISSVGGSGK